MEEFRRPDLRGYRCDEMKVSLRDAEHGSNWWQSWVAVEWRDLGEVPWKTWDSR
jgi:hypothetical protein